MVDITAKYKKSARGFELYLTDGKIVRLAGIFTEEEAAQKIVMALNTAERRGFPEHSADSLWNLEKAGK